MDAITYSDLRRNLKAYMDKVYNDHEPLIISRKNSENVVLLSIHEYNSLIETDYLLRNEANATHSKINDLIKEIERTPFTGTGKPEPLKYALSGY
ncbi:MAG: type II toxin-antitoxin system Phd/YefM family antitoxin [Treponema sp.]